MDLATIVVLLQAVLALLSAPNLTADQKAVVSGLANQALSIATQSITQSPSSTPVINTVNVPVSTGIATPPSQDIGAPSLPPEPVSVAPVTIIPPQPVPSCTLIGSMSSSTPIGFTWTLTNVPTSTTGMLYEQQDSSGWHPLAELSDKNYGVHSFQFYPQFRAEFPSWDGSKFSCETDFKIGSQFSNWATSTPSGN